MTRLGRPRTILSWIWIAALVTMIFLSGLLIGAAGTADTLADTAGDACAADAGDGCKLGPFGVSDPTPAAVDLLALSAETSQRLLGLFLSACVVGLMALVTFYIHPPDGLRSPAHPDHAPPA